MTDKKKTTGSGRTRNYATVVYPDSAPADWQETLAGHFVPAFISPLHDRDTNPGGEPKKPHYHVMIMFDNVKTTEQAQSIFSLIGGVGCEVVQSVRGYARYLCHMDNPEKVQYPQEEVRALCGADYSGVVGLATDKYKAVAEMVMYCEQHEIYSYRELLMYCLNERYDWYRTLVDSVSFVMKEYLKSAYWEKHNS